MTMARYDLRATDNAGNVISGATVEVRSEVPGQPLAPLFSDRNGTIPLGNPIAADANGKAGFFCAGGYYKITVTSGINSDELRYVGIGLAQGSDIAASGHTERVVTAAGDVVVATDDADIIIIRKAVGAATAVLLPDPSTTTTARRIVDGKYDAATNNITVTSAGVGKTIMGGASYIIDSNGAGLMATPLADGSGWI
jgi:hypothetical protein